MGIVEGEGGGDGHLFWIMLGVGLNSSMDPDRDSSCWGLVLWEEVRLLVGLSGGGGGWSRVESGVGAWTGLAVGVGLNSKGEGLWLTDSILLIRGYRECQPKLAVRRLLYAADAVILHLGGL